MFVIDKIILKFFTDLLYVKGIICIEEYDDIMSVKTSSDLDVIIEKMLREEYNVFKRAGVGFNEH